PEAPLPASVHAYQLHDQLLTFDEWRCVAERRSSSVVKSVATFVEVAMMRHVLAAVLLLSMVHVAAPRVAGAQTFKVEKFDIKGDGGTDYVAVEAATGRVFVSRATHTMVVEGPTGKVLGDLANTPGGQGAGSDTQAGHGHPTNRG